MEFGQPYYLLLLLLLPILILWYFKQGQNQEATIRYSNLDLIPESVIRSGRINNLVQGFVKTKGLIPSETCIYACGHPQMIEDVNKKFSGTEFEFLEERFWKEDE